MERDAIKGPVLTIIREENLFRALEYPFVRYMHDNFKVGSQETESGFIVSVERMEDDGKMTRMVTFILGGSGRTQYVWSGEEGADWIEGFFNDCEFVGMDFNELAVLEILKGDGVKAWFVDEVYDVEVVDEDGVIALEAVPENGRLPTISMQYDPDLEIFVEQNPNQVTVRNFLRGATRKLV